MILLGRTQHGPLVDQSMQPDKEREGAVVHMDA